MRKENDPNLFRRYTNTNDRKSQARLLKEAIELRSLKQKNLKAYIEVLAKIDINAVNSFLSIREDPIPWIMDDWLTHVVPKRTADMVNLSTDMTDNKRTKASNSRILGNVILRQKHYVQKLLDDKKDSDTNTNQFDASLQQLLPQTLKTSDFGDEDDTPMAVTVDPSEYLKPVKRAKNAQQWTRFANKMGRAAAFGPSLKHMYRLAGSSLKADQDLASTWYKNRELNDYVGSGKYRKRRRGTTFKKRSFKRRRSYKRRRSGYSGRGDYLSRGRRMWKGIPKPLRRMGVSFGRQMLSSATGGISDQVINAIGGRGAYYGGRGDYEANNLMVDDPSVSSSAPAFTSAGDEQGDIVITFKEYIGDIFGNSSGTLFSIAQYALNPGIEKTFPWLSQIAANFTEYEFIQCIFNFRSTVSDMSTSNGQVGTIIMATQYNPTEKIFQDKTEMMHYAHSNSAKSITSQIHGVECDPKMNAGPAAKYIRTVPLANLTGQSVTYDQGTFNIAIHGTPSVFANQSIGELWVSYTVKLNKPKIFTGLGKAISVDEFISNPTDTITLVSPVGANHLARFENGIGGVITSTTNGMTYTFPANAAGYYEVIVHYEGSNFTASGSGNPFAPGGQVTSIQDIYASSGTGDGPSAYNRISTPGSNRIAFYYHAQVKPNNSTGTNLIKFDESFSVGTLEQWSFRISEYNPTTETPPVWVDRSDIITAAV